MVAARWLEGYFLADTLIWVQVKHLLRGCQNMVVVLKMVRGRGRDVKGISFMLRRSLSIFFAGYGYSVR